MPSMATRKAIAEISMALVARWQTMTTHSLSSWRAMSDIAQAMNCELRPTKGSPSYVVLEDQDGPHGQAFINPLNHRNTPELNEIWMVRGAAHELGHHALYWWARFGWPWFWDLIESGLSLDDIEEMICDAIADLVWPMPDYLQKNGKYAAPLAAGPVLRRGWHNPTPDFMAMPATEIERHDAAQRKDAAKAADDELLSLFLEIKANLNSQE